MEENKQIQNYKFIIKAIIIAIGIIIIIGLFFVINNSKKNIFVEKYYINGSVYELDGLDEANQKISGIIINNYSDFQKAINNSDEAKDVLKGIIDENFFKNNSLIIFEYYISEYDFDNVILNNNVAKITISINENKMIKAQKTIKTVFIPIEGKEITKVDIKIKNPFSIYFNIFLIIAFKVLQYSAFIILPVVLLITRVIKFKNKKEISK